MFLARTRRPAATRSPPLRPARPGGGAGRRRCSKGTLLRTNFSSSRLVRLLGDANGAAPEAPRQDVAERLSHWVGAFDAVTLHSAHQSIQAQPKARAAAAPVGVAGGLDEAFQRVRSALVRSITATELAEAAAQAEPVFVPYRQHCLEVQRQMELKIAPLRAQVRQALSRASPRLRQLAVLDAVFETMLAAREQKLLSTVPRHLEQRFKALRKAQAPGAAAAAWAPAFAQEVQQVLLAELDVRLQPVMGLMEAWRNECSSERVK